MTMQAYVFPEAYNVTVMTPDGKNVLFYKCCNNQVAFISIPNMVDENAEITGQGRNTGERRKGDRNRPG